MRRAGFVAAGATAFASIALLRRRADAADFTYKWANDWPPGHPVNVRSVEAAQKILHDSGGQLEIKVFPAAQLGSSASMVTQARTGSIEFVATGYGVLEATVPFAGLAALPFAFAGHKEACDAMDGPFGKATRAEIVKAQLYAFERSWDGGFREVSNSLRIVRTPDDVKGLKIRVPNAPNWNAMFRALGASPTAVDGSEMYAACQTHLVDGTDLPLASIDSFKMYEVQKYASVTNHAWTGYAMVANPDAWNRLPPKLQQIVEQRIDEAGLLERADMVKLDAASEASLTAKGMTITHVDQAPFKAVVRQAGLYTQWRQQYGADGFDLLEKAAGKLT